jgi:hypothetical protein
VVVVDASDRTSYYPDEIREVTLMNDRYVLKLVFDEHILHIFSINILVLCAAA